MDHGIKPPQCHPGSNEDQMPIDTKAGLQEGTCVAGSRKAGEQARGLTLCPHLRIPNRENPNSIK